ncbi:MAG: hypothetical protein NVV73_18125 [Cellvibrionaceae bacterium]|nr:hypothetical protein [Cellvibrionaceae bacterium]
MNTARPAARSRFFDDDSPDPETRRILAELSQRHTVIYPSPDNFSQSKHGGLYANMQTAFSLSANDDLVCFLQDDTQLVRPLAPSDIEQLAHFFAASTKPCFVQPAFMRGCNRKKDQPLTRYDAQRRVYYVDRLKSSAGAFYSDICLFRVHDLQAAGWEFITREAGNEQQARAKLGQMAYWRDPFAAWLPNVPAFRGKTQTLALRVAQQRRRSGFYPIQYLTAEQNRAFVQRDPTILPYAEDCLQVLEGDVPKPWIYYPLQGSAPLKWLNSAESKIRKWLGR